MTEDTRGKTGGGLPDTSTSPVKTEPVSRSSERTRKLAEDIKRRSEEIRNEAERIRGLSMITLINVEMNYRTAQKAYQSVLQISDPDDKGDDT